MLDVRKIFERCRKRTFIKYFELFNNSSLSIQDIIENIEEPFTGKSKQTRTSKAKKILKEYPLNEIFDNILSSKRLDIETIEKTNSLYKKLLLENRQ